MSQIALSDEKIIWWKWRFGIPPEPYTELQEQLFTEIIKEMNLNSIEIEISALPELNFGNLQLRSLEQTEARQIPLLRRIKFPGGILGTHFHLDGKIYILNDKQWAKFSNNVINVFQDKLKNAGTINMEQFAKINETLTSF